MPTRNVNLTDELDRFVLKKFESGATADPVRNSFAKRSLLRCGGPLIKAAQATFRRVVVARARKILKFPALPH